MSRCRRVNACRAKKARFLGRIRAFVAPACAVLALLPPAAFAVEFGTDYGATIGGIWVGSASLSADIQDDRYSVNLTGEVGGVARIFSDMEVSLSSSGTVGEDGLLPETYQHAWRDDDDSESAEIRFDTNAVAETVVEPPPRRPERRVPVSEADLRNVLDIGAAFIWPAPTGAEPGLCDRTIPLFDGTQRYDLALSFTRTASFEARDGSYSGPALVCAIRYRPISGHRRDKEEVTFMAENEDLEVWMALAGDGYAIPVKIRIRTEHGLFGLEALDFGG